MGVRKAKHGWILTLVFSIISLLYVYPIVLVIINSFKKKAYISKYPFKIPTDKMFVGLENYVRGIEKTGLISAFGWSLFVTVFSVIVIIICCSMCAWYVCRVKNLYLLSVRYGCTVPDGNVYTVQNCEHAASGYSVGSDYYLPGLRSRSGSIHVHRIYEVYTP